MKPTGFLTTLVCLLVACGTPTPAAGPPADGPSGTINLYTSIDEATANAMVKAFRAVEPRVDVQLYRAATGQINARLATEQRSGGVAADVLWGPDPLTFHGYREQGLLLAWAPSGKDLVPPAAATDSFWGTTVLELVLITRTDAAVKPATWNDLTDPRLRDQTEIPSPSFAASAVGMLGYFAAEPGYGMDFFRKLKTNGTTQVDSPDTVITDVAAGRKQAGITLAFGATQAAAKGSPIQVITPDAGPIAVYGSAAVTKTTRNPDAAKAFLDFLLHDGQQVLEAQKRQPITGAGKSVTPDWAALADRKQHLLDEYQTIFGG